MDNHMNTEQEELQLPCERLFRVAILGFNREDVAAYLARITREHRKETERYASALRTAEENQQEDVPALREQNNLLESKNTALVAENEMLKVRIQDLEDTKPEDKGNCAELSDENELLKLQIQELEDKLKAAVQKPAESIKSKDNGSGNKNNNHAELEKALKESQKKQAQLEEKLRAFELEKNRATTVIEDARAKANQIEEEASERAATMINEAKQQILNLNIALSTLENTIDTATADYFEKLSANQKMFDNMKTVSAELRQLIAELQL